MKLILFLIIVLIIYFIASRIKIVHSKTLSDQEKKDFDERNRVRSLLMTNHIKCENIQDKDINKSEKFSNMNTTSITNTFLTDDNKLPSIHELLDMIKEEFLDKKYYFNMANLPVTTRYSNYNIKSKDKKYIKHIKNNINEWNEIFDDNQNSDKYIEIKEIKPIFIKETENEFIITINTKLSYLQKTLHIQITYYGQIEENDDFINNDTETDTYILQLIQFKPIHKNDYGQNITAYNNNIHNSSFITMDEQMAYVNKIKKMHENEEEYY